METMDQSMPTASGLCCLLIYTDTFC